MTTWEYRYIDLYRGDGRDIQDAFDEFTAEMRRAGAEGWEAVGEVNVQAGRPGRSDLASLRTVLMKRAKG
ncbi:hypothetical protein [Dactylosporangium sp. NPDC051541]|uniref:hypothetical protein n=1 Tax=Dactylosporangium sp. NPDC051541 TaxID=3363977 RepID=UPI0037AFA66F